MKRFWSKVDVRGPDECWEWTAGKVGAGYGHFKFDGKMQLAHRVAYLLEVDEIPEGMCVCHTCDNPACVNSAHLWVGTHTDNMADKVAKGRGPDTYGAKNPNVKLTEADVREIRASDEQGVKLALRFGVGKSQISRIRRGLTWPSIT